MNTQERANATLQHAYDDAILAPPLYRNGVVQALKRTAKRMASGQLSPSELERLANAEPATLVAQEVERLDERMAGTPITKYC